MVHLPGKYLGFGRLWRKMENKLIPENAMRPLEYNHLRCNIYYDLLYKRVQYEKVKALY